MPPTRLAEEARRRLRDSGYHALKEVDCDFHEGVLILRGRVPTFHMKQLAQVAVKDVAVKDIDKIIQIDNRLDVDG